MRLACSMYDVLLKQKGRDYLRLFLKVELLIKLIIDKQCIHAISKVKYYMYTLFYFFILLFNF